MIKLNARETQILKAHTNPSFTGRTVYTNSIFNYVELWLRQGGSDNEESLYYWQQAKAFYEASELLPLSAKPLTAYYCCLNASKALLACHGISLTQISHGVSSSRDKQKVIFSQNKIQLLPHGVFGELAKIIGEPQYHKEERSVCELLYNIPCVHRPYTLSYKSVELFIPVELYGFETDNRNRIAYLFRILHKYTQGNARRYIPKAFEEVPNGFHAEEDKYTYFRTKRKDRYTWDIHQSLEIRIENLKNYYKQIRPSFYYVDRGALVWYIKKELPKTQTLDRSPLLLIYALMHWMSELVRYNPQLFATFMDSKSNWLISEFVNVGLLQFVDGISSEITGANICLIDK